jgi:hypothetical protein
MSIALLLALASAATPLSDAEVDQIVGTFRQACIQGKAVFGPGEAKEIGAKDLDINVRRSYGHIDNARYYLIKKFSYPAYLVVWEHRPEGDLYTRGCALLGNQLPFVNTWEKVLNTRFDARARSRLIDLEGRVGSVEFPLPEEGKKLSARWAGTFVFLQASSMSKEETGFWKYRQSIKRSPVNARN